VNYIRSTGHRSRRCWSSWCVGRLSHAAVEPIVTHFDVFLSFGPGPVASDAGRSLGLVLDLADQDDIPVLGSLGSPAVRSAVCACSEDVDLSLGR